MKLPTLAAACALAVVCTAAHADEGMWTFHNPPLAALKSRHGFEPSAAWLQRLRLSALSTPDSASFVARDGLVLTNAHVALDCARDLSTPGADLIKQGFHARRRADERKCPGMELKQLVSFEEVTARLAASDRAERRRRVAALERECSDASGLRCEVVDLFRGAESWIYRYRVWNDVRLVFQPESDIAFFGGDSDNFVFPRYDLDVAFLRVYQDGKPFAATDYLRLARKGVADGDVVFSAGHPGSTDRLLTVAELLLLRDQLYPLRISGAADAREALDEYGKRSPEAKRRSAGHLFNVENTLKVWRGESKALGADRVLARKRGDENELKARAKAEIAAGRFQWKEGDPWERIEAAVRVENQHAFLSQALGYPYGSLAAVANDLVAAVNEAALPEGERLEKYGAARMPALRDRLAADTPFHKDMEAAVLAAGIQEAMDLLGQSHPFVVRLTAGRPPEQAAERLLAGTRLDAAAERKRLLDGGMAAVYASDDRLLAAVRDLYPLWAAHQRLLRDQVTAPKEAAYDEIARLRHHLGGAAEAPDATGTLRFSVGKVAGYDRDGVLTPWTTTFHGLFERHAALAAKPDFQLPPRWKNAAARLALATPFNFVSTLETIGGSSGSPIVNRDGDLVGIVFDGNLEGFGNRFAYSERAARSIALDIRAVMEALDKVYGARELLQELRGK
jgi:hypothetical protein